MSQSVLSHHRIENPLQIPKRDWNREFSFSDGPLPSSYALFLTHWLISRPLPAMLTLCLSWGARPKQIPHTSIWIVLFPDHRVALEINRSGGPHA